MTPPLSNIILDLGGFSCKFLFDFKCQQDTFYVPHYRDTCGGPHSLKSSGLSLFALPTPVSLQCSLSFKIPFADYSVSLPPFPLFTLSSMSKNPPQSISQNHFPSLPPLHDLKSPSIPPHEQI